MNDETTDRLIAASKSAMAHAYSPYSEYRVGAAVLGKSGRIYYGCNVENASYGLTICAERSAVCRMVCDGERFIEAVAISCSTGKPTPPCGACRQVLAEFTPEGETVEIYLASDEGTEAYTLAELLPHGFTLRDG